MRREKPRPTIERRDPNCVIPVSPSSPLYKTIQARHIALKKPGEVIELRFYKKGETKDLGILYTHNGKKDFYAVKNANGPSLFAMESIETCFAIARVGRDTDLDTEKHLTQCGVSLVSLIMVLNTLRQLGQPMLPKVRENLTLLGGIINNLLRFSIVADTVGMNIEEFRKRYRYVGSLSGEHPRSFACFLHRGNGLNAMEGKGPHVYSDVANKEVLVELCSSCYEDERKRQD